MPDYDCKDVIEFWDINVSVNDAVLIQIMNINTKLLITQNIYIKIKMVKKYNQ